MSQLTGSFTIETARLSRELALAVVAEFDRVDFVGAMADAVARRMAGSEGLRSGSHAYDREPDPDPGSGPVRGTVRDNLDENGEQL